MACNCNKRAQPTGFGSVTKPAPAPTPSTSGPAILTTPSGERREYGSALEAHADRIRLGGGTVAPK